MGMNTLLRHFALMMCTPRGPGPAPRLLAVLPAVSSARCAMGGVVGLQFQCPAPPLLSACYSLSIQSWAFLPSLPCPLDTEKQKGGGWCKVRGEVENFPQPMRMWAGDQGGFQPPSALPQAGSSAGICSAGSREPGRP